MRRTQPPHPTPGRDSDVSRPAGTRRTSWRSSLSGLSATPGQSGGGRRIRRRARAAESARLEIVCGETHRGFKSHRLRHMGLRLNWRGSRCGSRLGARVADIPRHGTGAVPPSAPDSTMVPPWDWPWPKRPGAAATATCRSERWPWWRDGSSPPGTTNGSNAGDPTAHAELLALSDAAAVARHLASVGGHPGGDPGAVSHVRRGPGGRPGGPAGLRGRRLQGRGLRLPLQPVRRPPAEPRGSVTAGIRAAEASALLSEFFAGRRAEQ